MVLVILKLIVGLRPSFRCLYRASELSGEVRLGSVSYTHLDVYKRQLLYIDIVSTPVLVYLLFFSPVKRSKDGGWKWKCNSQRVMLSIRFYLGPLVSAKWHPFTYAFIYFTCDSFTSLIVSTNVVFFLNNIIQFFKESWKFFIVISVQVQNKFRS